MTINIDTLEVESETDEETKRSRGDYLDTEDGQEESQTSKESTDETTEDGTVEGDPVQPLDEEELPPESDQPDEDTPQALTNEELLAKIEEIKLSQAERTAQPPLTPENLAAAMMAAESAKVQAAQEAQAAADAAKGPEYDFAAAQVEFNKAVSEADGEAASRIQGEMLQAQQAAMQHQMKQALAQTKQEVAQQTMAQVHEAEFVKVQNKLISEHEILDFNNPKCNKDALNLVNSHFLSLANKMPEAEALQQAVDTVLPLFQPKEETKPILGNRAQATKQAAAQAMKQQPSTKQQGSGTHQRDSELTEADIMKMPSKDWKKLSPAMLDKLSGNVI